MLVYSFLTVILPEDLNYLEPVNSTLMELKNKFQRERYVMLKARKGMKSLLHQHSLAFIG